MGHEIIVGQDQVMTVRQPPWHKLGVTVDRYLPWQDVKAMVTPWEAVAIPAYAQNGMPMATQAVIRSDTGAIIGEVGPDYRVFSNDDTWRFFVDVLQANDLKIETAGTLQGGRRVWVMAHAGDFSLLNGADPLKQYIYLSNAHDGSRKIMGGTVDFRIVCGNTERMALSSAAFEVKHTSGALNRLVDEAELMGLSVQRMEESQEIYERMLNTYPTDEEVDEVLEKLFPEDETQETAPWVQKRAEVQVLYQEGPNCNLNGMEQTAWGLYNAVTEWSDHYRPFAAGNGERRWLNITEGSGAELKEEALQYVQQLCY